MMKTDVFYNESCDKIGGRPKTARKLVDQVLKLYFSRDYSVPEIQEITGIKPGSLYQYLKARNQAEPTGG